MFCPYCGQDCGDAKFCSECGQDLRKWSRKTKTAPQKEQKPLDLEQYYQKYKPDRLQAIMALRLDTGMRAHEAQSAIDLIFDFHEGREVENVGKNLANEGQGTSNEAYCPECLSASVALRDTRGRRPRYLGFYNDAKTRAVASAIGLLCTIAEKTDEGNVECVCLKCGYIWKVN